MDGGWRNQLSQQICACIRSSEIFQKSHRIFAYFATQGEPDLTELWQTSSHKVWAFPRCEQQNLKWHPLQIDRLNMDTSRGKYGLTMPHQELPEISLSSADLLLIPALAIDNQGIRLGYGGGFYDRCLADQSMFTIGITYSQFLVDRLPRDKWDIPLASICTEQGLRLIQH